MYLKENKIKKLIREALLNEIGQQVMIDPGGGGDVSDADKLSTAWNEWQAQERDDEKAKYGREYERIKTIILNDRRERYGRKETAEWYRNWSKNKEKMDLDDLTAQTGRTPLPDDGETRESRFLKALGTSISKVPAKTVSAVKSVAEFLDPTDLYIDALEAKANAANAIIDHKNGVVDSSEVQDSINSFASVALLGGVLNLLPGGKKLKGSFKLGKKQKDKLKEIDAYIKSNPNEFRSTLQKSDEWLIANGKKGTEIHKKVQTARQRFDNNFGYFQGGSGTDFGIRKPDMTDFGIRTKRKPGDITDFGARPMITPSGKLVQRYFSVKKPDIPGPGRLSTEPLKAKRLAAYYKTKAKLIKSSSPDVLLNSETIKALHKEAQEDIQQLAQAATYSIGTPDLKNRKINRLFADIIHKSKPASLDKATPAGANRNYRDTFLKDVDTFISNIEKELADGIKTKGMGGKMPSEWLGDIAKGTEVLKADLKQAKMLFRQAKNISSEMSNVIDNPRGYGRFENYFTKK